MMDYDAEIAKLQKEIQNITDAANVEIGKRHGKIELLQQLKKEAEVPEE